MLDTFVQLYGVILPVDSNGPKRLNAEVFQGNAMAHKLLEYKE